MNKRKRSAEIETRTGTGGSPAAETDTGMSAKSTITAEPEDSDFPGAASSVASTMATVSRDELEKAIFSLVRLYHKRFHAPSRFVPGKSQVRYAGRVYDEEEIVALVDSALEFWLTAGRYATEFEEKFSRYLGVKHTLLTNSGSSANLLAISSLTSGKLGERRLRPGDEVITAAASFPTTVNPIVQKNLIPVFVDVELGTYNVAAESIREALSEKTRAIFLAHTLGNPFDIEGVSAIVKERDLFLWL